MEDIKWELKKKLHHLGIQHVTIECETIDSVCKERSCC